MLRLPLISTVKKSTRIDSTLVKCCRSQSTSSSSLSYCLNLVKTLDYENYLCTLLLPRNLRVTAFALRAFNIELSRIQEQVSETEIMPIRFKFWYDCLNDVYNDKTVVNHPVVIELRNAVNRHKLSKMFLKRLIASRSNLLNRSTFSTTKEMILYADQTNSPIYMLLLEAFGVKNMDSDHVASHLGIAQGVANLVRAVPFNIKEKLILLPMTTLIKHGVSEESFLRMSVGSKMNDIIYDVTNVIEDHLNIARSLEKKIPEEQRSIFLPAVSIREFLRRLEKNQYDIFASEANIRKGFLSIILMWNHLMKTY